MCPWSCRSCICGWRVALGGRAAALPVSGRRPSSLHAHPVAGGLGRRAVATVRMSTGCVRRAAGGWACAAGCLHDAAVAGVRDDIRRYGTVSPRDVARMVRGFMGATRERMSKRKSERGLTEFKAQWTIFNNGFVRCACRRVTPATPPFAHIILFSFVLSSTPRLSQGSFFVAFRRSDRACEP